MESVLRFLGIEGITLREGVIVGMVTVFIYFLGRYIQRRD